MWRARLFACWLLVLVGVLGTGGPAAAAQVGAPAQGVFVATASLSGREEVPPVLDTRGSALAVYRLSPDGTALEYTLVAVELTSPPVMAHIHAPAPPGVNAPVVAHLFPPNPHSSCTSTSSLLLRCEGRILASDLERPLAGQPLSALLAIMAAGNSYTNVHTTRHPAGELRGQNQPLVNLSALSAGV
jgi:hypothetical protein